MNVLEVITSIKELQNDRLDLIRLKDRIDKTTFGDCVPAIENCIQMIDDEIDRLYQLKIKEQ